jgi:hypothetical protein
MFRLLALLMVGSLIAIEAIRRLNDRIGRLCFSAGGRGMFTTILVYVLAVAGIVMIAAGACGVLSLMSARNGPPIPPGYYVIMIGAICSGFGLLGVAQGLRLLLLIYRTVGHF